MTPFGDKPIQNENDKPENILTIADEGGNAYWDDVPLTKNPYRLGDPKHKSWEYGWKNAESDVMNPPKD